MTLNHHDARPLAARPRLGTDIAITCAAIAGATASMVVVPDLGGLAGALLALAMLATAVIDGRHGIIPDELNAMAFGLALLNAATQAPDAIVEAATDAVLRGAVLALLFLAARIGYRRVRGRQGIGLGDVKLAGVAGAWLSWLAMPIAVEVAAVAALAVYALRQWMLGRPFDPTTRLPFGLFFAPAIWLAWLIDVTLLSPA
jgi:leader peptidase (prepilin peptidase)/N-methyltransferase